MTTRRQFLGAALAGAAAGLMPPIPALARTRHYMYRATAAILDPTTQVKFSNPLRNPLDPENTWRPTGFTADPANPAVQIPVFDLQIRQFRTEIGLRDPATGAHLQTTLWGYGSAEQESAVPGRTFEATPAGHIQVSYSNQLVDADGNTLPHLLPIDTTLHWANTGNDGATAPVPLVAHLHGGNTRYISDGLPLGWSTPNNATHGPLWSTPFLYDNNQEAGHLWYHDHAFGITRLNIYTGLAGNYFIRGPDEAALVARQRLPAYPYEVALMLQDHMFHADGSLYYPSDPSLYPFDPGTGPLMPLPNPTHLPEFFGQVMQVNWTPWPRFDVEPRQYRLRLIDISDSRVYDLRLVAADGTTAPLYVIGDELGLLNAPVPVDHLRIASAERYDLIADFTGFAPGTRFTLTNSANAPYPDGDPVIPGLTDQIMQFVVGELDDARPPTMLPDNLRPVSGPLLPPDPSTAVKTRRILLVEGTDPFGRLMTMIGPVDPVPAASGGGTFQGTLFFLDPVTETPTVGTTEIWEFYNTTQDAHPIHIHLVNFRILNREDFLINGGNPNANFSPKNMGGGYVGGIVDPAAISLVGNRAPPAPHESGRKDTALMFPGQVTRVMMTFDRVGSYIYHCHITSHEDHEMMRPYQVMPAS